MEKRLKELMHQAVVMESSFDVIDGIHIYDEVERLEKIEDRLLAQWAYAKASGNDAQHLADLLGYTPDLDSPSLKPLITPWFQKGDKVQFVGGGKFNADVIYTVVGFDLTVHGLFYLISDAPDADLGDWQFSVTGDSLRRFNGGGQ